MTNQIATWLKGVMVSAAIGCCILLGTESVYAQGEPVTKRWLLDMSASLGSETISNTIESNGIAFLPTQAVRAELAGKVNENVIRMLPKHFAANTTFMVCEFTCENCGTSTNPLNTFNDALLDKIRDRKAAQNRDPNYPLYNKQMQSGLGPSAGPPREEEIPVPIVVFITGHMSKQGSHYRISASLQYRNKGERPKPIGPTREFTSNANLRTAAKTVGSWALDSLLAEVR